MEEEMNQIIEVTEIRLKIGNKELILTAEQAKKLRDVLVGLLGSNVAYPYQIYTTPSITALCYGTCESNIIIGDPVIPSHTSVATINL
jgi:hypothetical protein